MRQPRWHTGALVIVAVFANIGALALGVLLAVLVDWMLR